MSHLTCCPACGTTFRVVEDQLRLASGWVRCGVCQHVYDAMPGLRECWPLDEPDKHSSASCPAPTEHVSAVPQPMGQVQDRDEGPPTPKHGHEKANVEALLKDEPAGHAEMASSTSPLDDQYIGPVTGFQAVAGEDLVTEGGKPAFVRQAEQQAFWRQPVVRLGLACVTLLLALGLAVQVTWLWRDQMAARWPQLQPSLAMFCHWFNCTLDAPRQADALHIESSVLLRDEGDRYRFELTVRNAADHAVAAPALELTLLDVSQMVRLQRVFPTSDWPGSKTKLEAGEIWSVRFEFELNPAVAASMAGYRAWLFYL